MEEGTLETYFRRLKTSAFPAMSTSAYFWEAPEVERKERDIGNSSCPSKVVDEALQWER